MRANPLTRQKEAPKHIERRACSILILRCAAEGGASKDEDGPVSFTDYGSTSRSAFCVSFSNGRKRSAMSEAAT